MLATVAASVALYGAPIWANALEGWSNVRRMLAVQRLMAIRICRGYRKADTNAVLVIASQIPWDLAARERAERDRDRIQL